MTKTKPEDFDFKELLAQYRLSVMREEDDLSKRPKETSWTAKRQEFEAELLRRLGAAVSASPQPSVDIKQKCINFICQYPYPTWEQLVVLVESCFAAAPAQEPRLCPKCGTPVCDPYKSTETGMWTQRCNKCEWFDSWAGLAQERPVENSPQKHCLGYPDCDGMLPGEEHEKECPLVGTFGPPSPQKGAKDRR